MRLVLSSLRCAEHVPHGHARRRHAYSCSSILSYIQGRDVIVPIFDLRSCTAPPLRLDKRSPAQYGELIARPQCLLKRSGDNVVVLVIGTPEGPVHQDGTCTAGSRAHEDHVEQGSCSGAAGGVGCEGAGLLRLLQRHERTSPTWCWSMCWSCSSW